MTTSEAARLLSLARPRRKRVCPTCGKEFESIGPAKYCSGLCRWQAWDKRRRLELSRAESPAASREEGA